MRYVLGRPSISQEFDPLFQLDVLVDCGQINFEFVYEDGSPIDRTLFFAPSSDTDPKIFKVLEQKNSRSVATYKIRYRATLDSYPEALATELETPFTVTIVSPPSPSVYVFNIARLDELPVGPVCHSR